MSETLNQISVSLEAVIQTIGECEETGQEIPSELIECLESALTKQAEKVDSCAMFISRAKSEIDWLKSEEELLSAKRKRIERGIERMKDLAKFVMEREGVKELTGMRGHKFSLRESQSVEVVDESLVPAEFTRIVQKVEVNKADALKAMKNGVEVSGLSLLKKQNVIVK